MKQNTRNSILLNARLNKYGVTLYVKNGRTVMRPARSLQPVRRTEAQFDVRERHIYIVHLWKDIKEQCRPLFQGPEVPYHLFCRLAAKLPALYLTAYENAIGCTPLLPGIPLSCGTLPDIACRLGALDGSPALLTDLTADTLQDDQLMLVTLRQLIVNDNPRLYARVRPVGRDELVESEGGLALVDNLFGDNRRGWTLVRCRGSLRSTQTLVTASTLHLRYTTPEARQRALDSYGGEVNSEK